MAKTLKELAQQAIAVQDACNLSGVARSFAACMSELCTLIPFSEINTHPIAILWSDKIAHLTGTQNLGNDMVMRAYPACYALAESTE